MRVHDFYCDPAIEASIKAFVNAGHTAGCYLANELIALINEFTREIGHAAILGCEDEICLHLRIILCKVLCLKR